MVFLLDPVKNNHTKDVQQQSMWYEGTHYFVQIDTIIMEATVTIKQAYIHMNMIHNIHPSMI